MTVYKDEIERWKDVVGYEGLYQVSNYGKVKSLTRFRKNHSNGTGYWTKEIQLTIGLNHGYPVVDLFKNGKHRQVYAYVLVCTAFHGPRPSLKHGVAHNDDNPLNSFYKNLRWATQQENLEDMVKRGRSLKGNAHPFAITTEHEVREMRVLHDNGVIVKEIADKYGIKYHTAYAIVKRITWSWLT